MNPSMRNVLGELKGITALTVMVVLFLGGSLAMVEYAAFDKLEMWRLWFDSPDRAFIGALALVCLLICSVVATAAPIFPEDTKRLVRIVMVGLLICQGMAQILLSFQHSYIQMPVDVPRLFAGVEHLDEDWARRFMSSIGGGILTFSSVIFWEILAKVIQHYILLVSRTSKQYQMRAERQRQKLEHLWQDHGTQKEVEQRNERTNHQAPTAAGVSGKQE